MVTLRPFVQKDIPALQRIVSGRTARFTHGHDMTADEAATTVRRFIDHDQDDPRTHWDRGIELDGDLIGLVKARLRADGAAALSYLLREDTWGNGHATDAVRRFIPLVLADGVQRMEAKHHPDNAASGRVLVKAGFVPVGVTPAQQVGDRTLPPHPLYELRAQAPFRPKAPVREHP
ncbi:GNAT family N-acetyltransferase [Streptomyces cinerochromogenes]|uniref:GNAT family N-acetyltransferase n=1 Tax=Streptomyces cinerochromogenes TaxID=66422 RepID=UPI00368EE34A